MTESCRFPTISNIRIPGLLSPFLLWLHMWYSWPVSEHIIWHLWNTPRKPAEIESVLKMCERFGPFIKEAHFFFHVLPHGVLSPNTPFLFCFFFSCSFPLFIWGPTPEMIALLYCITHLHIIKTKIHLNVCDLPFTSYEQDSLVLHPIVKYLLLDN